ncbi:MAG: hypothetical protein ISP86_05055 [Shewanellaceae bacterium]|nr:hypothetical protein [Shewanellaceae bacterium]
MTIKTQPLMPYLLALLMMTGCNDVTEDSNNVSLPDSLIDVEYTDAGTPESEIGIPTRPFSFDKLTEFNIEVELHSDYRADLNVIYNSSDHNFDPTHVHSFVMRSSNMTVTDSNNTEYNLVLYLIPLADKPGELMVLATLDDVSISFLTMSHAQQAFFIDTFNNPYYANNYSRQSTKSSSNNESTPYSTMHPNWVGKSIDSSISVAAPQYQPMLPKLLELACYKPMADASCQTKSDSNSNIQGQTLNYLQPIAPLGMRNKNWYTFDYQDPLLKDYILGTTLSSEQVAAAQAETIQALRTSNLPEDIGWFGLSAQVRSQLNRLHYIGINLKFSMNNASATQGKMYVKEIKRRVLSDGSQADLFDLSSATVDSDDELVGNNSYTPLNIDFQLDSGLNTIVGPK